jgi:arylsulfatase A-like enzyme
MPRSRRLALLAFALLAVALLLGACARAERGSFELLSAVRAGALPSGVHFPALASASAPVSVEVGEERRLSLVGAAEPWSYRGPVPEDGFLALGVALEPGPRAADLAGLELVVEVVTGRHREVLEVARAPRDRWCNLVADLRRFAGRRVELTVEPRALAGGSLAGQRLAWSPVRLVDRRQQTSRPNVLFVLVDTLRADHLSSYGYARPTSPEIDRWLGAAGARFETAYSQAPWTIPSVISFQTSLHPGELLQGPMETYALPAGVPTLAERFAVLGYETAGFFGNYVLRDGAGFGRGFGTRWVPPADPSSNFLHADAVNERAIPWLAAHAGGAPFFAYVHYMDPHDPYESPDLVDGRSPFYPGYRGRFAGTWVHGLYTGGLELDDPVEDVAHLTALYDSEIAYVDRAIGRLLASLPPEVLANTLIVLTSDHGEELYDHGGFKHGQSLYQHQIRVPLFVRWDGVIPPGQTLTGEAALLDLVPTLMAAAGGKPDPSWRGLDLLPVLRGESRLPRRPIFAQNLATGPLRSAVVLAGQKLQLFNAAEPFAPANATIAHLWQLDRARLEPRELYDLAQDPDERVNRVGSSPEAAEALSALLDAYLDRALPGLRVRGSGLAPEQTLEIELVLDAVPSAWHPYFLDASDRVRVDQRKITLTLVGEPAGSAEKGLWLEGEDLGLESLAARLDGVPLAAARLLIGAGKPHRSGAVASAALLTDRRPEGPAEAAVRVWARSDLRAEAATTLPPEVEKSLRALGYIQ